MEIVAVIAGGVLSVSFLIAVYFWNKRSYRKISKTQETDAHRVEQNDTIKHYKEKIDKLSKLKRIEDAEIVESNFPGILSQIVGAVITLIVGYNVWQEVAPAITAACASNISNSTTESSCGLINTGLTLFPIAAVAGVIILIFSIISNIFGFNEE